MHNANGNLLAIFAFKNCIIQGADKVFGQIFNINLFFVKASVLCINCVILITIIKYYQFKVNILNYYFYRNMSNKRAAIIELHRVGKTEPEIVKLLKASRSTVYYTVRRFQELKSTEDRP